MPASYACWNLRTTTDRPPLPAANGWKQHLADQGCPASEVLRREHQRQAANQVSIGNCITSLRLLAVLDWNEFFKRTSLVEAILRDDPTGVYVRQDFATPGSLSPGRRTTCFWFGQA